MLRVVLDTNIFVSSLLTHTGSAARVLDVWRERHFVLVISPAIIDEIQRVLRYPHIQRKYAITEADIVALTELLQKDALLVPGMADVAGTIPEDPTDEIMLACALDGLADCIVSGDHHLLNLATFRGIPVLTVREFLDRLAAGSAPGSNR